MARYVFMTGIWVSALLVSVAPEAAAQAPEAEKSGLAVGEEAPPIKLKDQNGKEQSLDKMLHDGTVALVFFRSASW